MSNTHIFGVWGQMIQRCTNPKLKAYPDYGGRGITVCERWRSFENFFADMGTPPEGMEIDRIDNSKGYEPGNCRWTTPKVNARNRRSSRLLTAKGATKTQAEWCEELKVNSQSVTSRLKRGWTDEEALLTPFRALTKRDVPLEELRV